MQDTEKQAPFTQDLQSLFDRFTVEFDLNFAEKVPNLFDFVSQNALKVDDDQILLEEDLTAFAAEDSELPICTNRNLQPIKSLMDKCFALGLPPVSWGHVPVLEVGPGILIAHYDPFAPIPNCFHRQNAQVVLCTLSTYRKLRDAFNERYQPPTIDQFTPPNDEMPQSPTQWATWQLEYNPADEQGKAILEGIRLTDSFEDAPPEWEYWFQNKSKSKPCISLSILEIQPDSKLIASTTLKSIESVVLFENRRLLQMGYVLNWSHYNSVEAIVEQCSRQGRVVQTVTLVAQDYTRFVEEQINRQISLNAYINKDDIANEILVDEIDPTQFTDDLLDKDDEKIKKMSELIIFSAYKRAASDILIEPQANDYRVRFTIDGMNTVFHTAIPKNYGTSIVAHLKVRASMSITERRLPQDGKITLQIKGKPVEMRAATMPVRDSSSLQEEKMTLRLLSATVTFPNLDRIGMSLDHLRLVRKSLSMANGIVIVTGPTGSGKTTTLYAAIQELDRERLNIVSLEDPIESYIGGITQTQINDQIGLTFALGLRAILRQAPHVILLGEIRDREVANIAVQSANTGHLVLTTLHTNSALGTFSRLQALGAETHQIADAVRLIMSQRLIPKLCPVCRKNRRSTDVEKVRIEKLTRVKLKDQIYHANLAGCRSCHKGYVGRRILTELIPVDSSIREMLLRAQQNIPSTEIAEHAAKHFKYTPLLSQAVDLVNEAQVDLRDAQRLFLDFGE